MISASLVVADVPASPPPRSLISPPKPHQQTSWYSWDETLPVQILQQEIYDGVRIQFPRHHFFCIPVQFFLRNALQKVTGQIISQLLHQPFPKPRDFPSFPTLGLTEQGAVLLNRIDQLQDALTSSGDGFDNGGSQPSSREERDSRAPNSRSVLVTPSRSALLMTKISPISITPAFMVWISSPIRVPERPRSCGRSSRYRPHPDPPPQFPRSMCHSRLHPVPSAPHPRPLKAPPFFPV